MVASLRPANLLKKRLWHRCFPVNFAKFIRTHFFYRTPLVAASVGEYFETGNRGKIFIDPFSKQYHAQLCHNSHIGFIITMQL